MTWPNGTRSPWARAAIWVLASAAALAWTAGAGFLVATATFAAADTRCGEAVHHPRANMRGIWMMIVVLAIWIVPFALGAALRRSQWLGVLTLTLAAIATGFVSYQVTHPQSFCF